MPVETDADRLALLADFGVACTYTPHGLSARAITVIFDKEAKGVDALTGQTVTMANPHLVCRDSDLVGTAETRDRFAIAGISFAPRDFLPDGTGMTTVELKKV